MQHKKNSDGKIFLMKIMLTSLIIFYFILISYGCSGLYIWDIRTGELILQDDTAMPNVASYMHMDERYIAYGQNDGGVIVFDWSSRTSLEVVGSYQAHDGDVSGTHRFLRSSCGF
jgi:hypothetical protein